MKLINRIFATIIFLIFLAACGEKVLVIIPDDYITIPPPSLDIKLDHYDSCQELVDELKEQVQEKRKIENSAYDDCKSEACAQIEVVPEASLSDRTLHTNVQVSGIDEGDRYKVGAEQIYILNPGYLEVFARHSLKYLGDIELNGIKSGVILTYEKKIVVIGQLQNNRVRAVIMQHTGNNKIPEIISTTEYTGNYRESRLVDGRLYFLVQDEQLLSVIENNNVDDSVIDDYVNTLGEEISCTSVVKRNYADFDYRFNKIIEMDLSNEKSNNDELVFIGGGDHFYMTDSELLLIKQEIKWYQLFGSFLPGQWPQKVFIFRISVVGEMQYTGAGEVEGNIKDRWGVKTYDDGILSLVVSQNDNMALFNEQNYVKVLSFNDEKNRYEEKSMVGPFGINEEIKAVRYIGEMLYAVTYRLIDPVFAIDMSDLDNPKLLSSLEIPGFSFYLHPIDENIMGGVGFSESGRIEISLFDTTVPSAVERFFNYSLSEENLNTEVMNNPQAFFYGQDVQLLAIPIRKSAGSPEIFSPEMFPIIKSAGSPEISSRPTSGALFLKRDGEVLIEAGIVSHDEIIPQRCKKIWYNEFDIDRIFEVDGRVITISNFGIKEHNPTEISETLMVSSINANAAKIEAICVKNGYWQIGE
ncbi:MAG: hypothetical protein A2504_10410 [Bdellovibrionales bacterium RIFOXYD12_FULL_39_22]|nr:MAG: hypothetical protein A2385_17025 [Bdellovibrionales bacterium RIFOXYB1_FULL_39_21]OFZ44108.1 MAG: hypothetical protein A2485_14215 [Bdellovibrionales bacterium RIFOXYC12_FULL_39_17]OFZ48658.1 MAG: hypothetical protein A2404_08230 [Bdellovibrionales bacterium RIFOXYC1_FULL_39_130]OFZ70253.1 MAG: hypothetical protein A2451_11665 [Bdellovibrionales bacterium RIFOXYC2_FULL_39_8]OFZ76772.1 MAG: hypothetical protein A2560_10520 [Bdellovibrionales bacterium RIFOXYD1_FULL_39_84]OFZ95075.1 MAG: